MPTKKTIQNTLAAETQQMLRQRFTTLKGELGVEVECIISHSNLNVVENMIRQKNWENGYDGSIRTSNSGDGDGREIKLRYDLVDIDRLFQDYEKLAELIKVNKSCGLHFHISFKDPIVYFKLASYDFVKFFQDGITALFTTEAERYRLSCRFCSLYASEQNFSTYANKQLNSPSRCGESRYKAINFNAYNLHKTIEFRIFAPTVKIEVFKKYVLFLLRTIEEYIANNKLSIDVVSLKDTMIAAKPIYIEEFL